MHFITIPFVGASLDAKKGYDQVFGYIFGYATKNEDGTTEQGIVMLSRLLQPENV